MNTPPKDSNPTLVLEKLKNWCAYQDRCQEETRQKLYQLGVFSLEAENIIIALMQDGFLHEERYAKSFVRGKFNIKHWGRIKIKAGLKTKKIPEKLIADALKEIDEKAYFQSLLKVLEIKSKTLKEKNPLKKNYKLMQYAYGKGYEQDLIVDALKDLGELL